MRKLINKVGRKMPGVSRWRQELHTLRNEKGILQLEKGNLEAVIRDQDAIINSKRNFLAERYITGQGIEIGAAQMPVKLPPKASVKYVDVFSAEDLKKALPLYSKLDIVDIDVVDDGEKLTKFKNNSLDFIIANHFIEHCIDPIGTLINMYKKLRDEGVLYLAIPDKRYTFDLPRPLTTYDHLLEEHQDKTGQKFKLEHTLEYVKVKLGNKGRTGNKIEKRVQELLKSGYRIHYHVWTQREMTEMLTLMAHDFKLDFEIEALLKNHHEVIYILRKKPAHKPIDYTPQM